MASVQAVGEAIRRCRRPPRVFVQTTAVGIYGDSGDRICDESTPPGGGFLGETCRQWEKAFDESPTPGVRRVVLRLGVVLGREGGAFPPLAGLARWFLGGAVGRGRQYISWLHLADAVRIYREAIDRERFSGHLRGRLAAAGDQRPIHAGTAGRTPPALEPARPALAVRLGGWLAGINAELR